MSFQTPSAVAVDSLDRVYVFQRRGPPVMVFDRDGTMLAAWPRQKGHPVVNPVGKKFLPPVDLISLTAAGTTINLSQLVEVVARLKGRYDKALTQTPASQNAEETQPIVIERD